MPYKGPPWEAILAYVPTAFDGRLKGRVYNSNFSGLSKPESQCSKQLKTCECSQAWCSR